LVRFEHFVSFAKPTMDKKVILLLGGHASHKTLEAVEICRENGVVLVCLPPHSIEQFVVHSREITMKNVTAGCLRILHNE